MKKLMPNDLERIREEMRAVTNLREGTGRARITMHMGTCGIASGARAVLNAFLTQIEGAGASDVILTTSGCAGLCSREPMATVELRGETPVKYVDLDEEKAARVFREHVQNGQIVAEFALGAGSERVS